MIMACRRNVNNNKKKSTSSEITTIKMLMDAILRGILNLLSHEFTSMLVDYLLDSLSFGLNIT